MFDVPLSQVVNPPSCDMPSLSCRKTSRFVTWQHWKCPHVKTYNTMYEVSGLQDGVNKKKNSAQIADCIHPWSSRNLQGAENVRRTSHVPADSSSVPPEIMQATEAIN